MRKHWERLWKFMNTTAGAVILTAVVSGISFTAIFDTTRQWVITAFNFVLDNVVFVNVTIQLWQFFVFTFGPVAVLLLVSVYREDNKTIENIEEIKTIETVPELEGLILKIFDDNYGARLWVEDIARILNNSDLLRVQQAVGTLAFDWDFLQVHNDVTTGLSFTLNGNGANYILEKLRN